MTVTVSYADVEVGTALPPLSVDVQRVNLVMYCGASGDFNPIHWNQRFAQAVGLPDVIAHGMFTMASACRVVTNWVGDPGAVVEYGVRFTRPVVVPDDDKGAVIEVTAVVDEKREDGTVRVTVTATSEGQTVLGRAQAVVRLA
jgi:acyl dehydratase